MMQHPDKEHTLKGLTGIRTGSPGIPWLHGLRLAGIVFVALIAALFTNSFVSAKPATVGTSNFCMYVEENYVPGTPYCQIGDKDRNGWYVKNPEQYVPPMGKMRVRNLGGNPGTGGRLTIYTPQLYCAGYWDERVGRGYVEVNGQRFPTCRGFENDLGPGGYNYGAKYLYLRTSMVRIITNIRVAYGETITIRIYGRIYAAIRDDCRKALNNKCWYPAISPGWVYSYTKTDTAIPPLAKFYKANRTCGPGGAKKIYDFLTIKYGDLDFDDFYPDYYDFDDLSMTFALAEY